MHSAAPFCMEVQYSSSNHKKPSQDYKPKLQKGKWYISHGKRQQQECTARTDCYKQTQRHLKPSPVWVTRVLIYISMSTADNRKS